MRQPSWDGSDEVDIETIAILVEFPLGIIMETSFQMKLQFQEEIDMNTHKMFYPELIGSIIQLHSSNGFFH